MNRNIILGGFSFLILLSLVMTFSFSKVSPQTHSIEYEDAPKGKIVDLYNFYYATETILLLNQYSDQEYIDKIHGKLNDLVSIEHLIRPENKGGLYDVWLYVNSLKSNEIKLEKIDKIITYLKELQTKEGFFLSYKGESVNVARKNYLLSSKMSLDIMSHYKKEIPSLPDIQIWINKVFHDLNTHTFDDFISYGNYLYLMKYIEETYLPESVKGLRIREPSLSAVTIGAESRGDDSIHLKKTSRNKASLVQSLNGNIGSQSIIPTRSRKCAGMSETMDYVFRSGASFVWHALPFERPARSDFR
ncbi:hypothetical protein ABD76_00550 [Paenibacillus dendritiformis]|nr:hypothetical protein [Paenibacillus dendritiformis]